MSNTDLQDIIAQSSIKAFNAGYQTGKAEGYRAGIEMALEAAKFVQFEHYDLDVVALSDFEEELKDRANLYHSDRQITLSEPSEQG